MSADRRRPRLAQPTRRRQVALVLVALVAVAACSRSETPAQSPEAAGAKRCEDFVRGLDDPGQYLISDVDELATTDSLVQEQLTPEQLEGVRQQIRAMPKAQATAIAWATCMQKELGAECGPTNVQAQSARPEQCFVASASGQAVPFANPWAADLPPDPPTTTAPGAPGEGSAPGSDPAAAPSGSSTVPGQSTAPTTVPAPPSTGG